MSLRGKRTIVCCLVLIGREFYIAAFIYSSRSHRTADFEVWIGDLKFLKVLFTFYNH